MTTSLTHIIYGIPPRPLLDWPADAHQYSPLIPDAKNLESLLPDSVASAIIHTPPSTFERRYVLATILQALTIGAPLMAVGLKDKGGNRIAEELQHWGCEVTQTSRNHYRICQTTCPAMLHHIEEALQQGSMRLDKDLGLWTQPGIFSWDRIDAGTQLLLEYMPTFTGNGADFGCGLGILSQAALTSPLVKSLLLTDIDRRAVEASQRNITDPRAQFLWADIRTDLLPVSGLDFVLMNPPFHDRGQEDKSLGQAFIERAAALLKKGGVCWCVANRHLPYESLLKKLFARTQLVVERDGFKIYAAEK